MKQLENLNLAGSPVTNEGLKTLAGLIELRSLNLDRTQVSDVGLKALTGFKQLQSLNLPGRVTDEAIGELQKVLPRTVIIPGRPPFTM